MNVVILAAGKGKRMHSDLPKVLHPIAGKPMLAHVVDTARKLGAGNTCVVYGHGGEQVREALAAPDLTWAKQEPQLGTGHAVLQALPQLDPAAPTLVLYGDVPLIRAETLARLLKVSRDDTLALLTVKLPNPKGYGRIVRAQGRVTRIVEEKDADDAERAIDEVNTGILVAPTAALQRWLPGLGNSNAQGEYYLTDIVGLAVGEGMTVEAVHPDHAWEVEGVNSKPFARLRPGTVLGTDVHIGNFVEVKNSSVADHSKANHLAYVGDATVGSRVNVGAGTITCNYDGANKFRTVIEDDVFIGSDTQLVAPVTVGKGATLGAGTTLTKDAPAGQLTVSRARQATIPGWTRPVKQKKG
ncbi:MAG: NTP transferase domain-containing protein [Rhodocyclales bacterium]|nr:NTP transferase domain-containing protein [Rhodocyclales bacterium]